MPTLLEKAKKVKIERRTRQHFNEEDYELVLAFLLEEITISQLAEAKGKKVGNCYGYIAIVVQNLVRDGILTIKRR